MAHHAQGNGRAAALVLGLLGSIAIAAVTAAAAMAEERLFTPPPPPSPVLKNETKPRPKRRHQSFLSISPRGEYWWELSNAQDWLLLPQALLSSHENMMLWQALQDNSAEGVAGGFASKFENIVEVLVRSGKCSQADRDQILRDIPRTFPDDEYFSDRDVQDSMERVLICMCLEYPQVGYVQSMNFLCSFLFLHCKSEDACFALFRVLMEHKEMGMAQMYAPGLPMLFRVLQVFEQLLERHAPVALSRMRELDMELMMFAQTWFMTLFTYSMDWQICGPVWDAFFQRGWEAPLRVAVFLVAQCEGEIAEGDFETISALMRDACANAPLDLMERADMIKFSQEDLLLCHKVVE